MSVCMSLYKINSNVSYNGYYLDFIKKSDFEKDDMGVAPINRIEKELNMPENAYEVFVWMDSQEINAWSDKIRHTFFDYKYYKEIFKNSRGWKRVKNRLSKYNFKIFDNGMEKKKYLALDRVEYAQGWFFNKRFYKKEVTVVFCTTKRELENFFKQYIRCRTVEERKIVNNFLNSWEDGMLFECSW